MATQPTQDAVPSESPRDLKFNAGKIDEFVTSENHVYVDRFGDEHRTIAGINYDANQAISQYGYITKDSFEDSSTISLANECLRWKSNGEYYRWDGSLPKVVPPSSTPDSTGGIGQGKWVGVGDASLRADLDKNTGATLSRSSSGKTVQQEIDILKMGYKTPDDFPASGADDTAALLQAFSWSSTTGMAVRIPSKTYVWNGGVIPYDNVTIIGDKRPYADSGLTRLLDGSIIVGTLRFSGKNVQISNIGVDHGSFRFPSTPGDALIVSATGKAGQYAVIKNCIGLGRNPTDAFHAILCEGYKYSIVED